MSGTLQRIAASAIRPQPPRVHPFVESIFAVPREEGFAAPILQQEIQPAGVPPPKTSPPDTQTSQPAAIGETVIERPSQLLDPRPAQRSARVLPLPSAAPAAGNASLPTAASSAGRESFQPLLPQPAHSEQEKEASTLPQQATSAAERAAGSSAPEWPSSAIRPAASSPAWSFAPLVSEVGDEGDRKPAVPAGEARSAIAARRDPPFPESRTVPGRGPGSAARNARGQRAPQPQTNEIQIHIGRVEVIAMHPPAPRAVPAPVRRSQSLDEYLRRSNGRAG